MEAKNGISYDQISFNLTEINAKSSIELFGEILAYLHRATFESAYKSNYMTEILDFEVREVESPEQFDQSYSGWRYIDFMDRNFTEKNPLKHFFDEEFRISDSVESVYLRPWRNVISVNDMELDDLFKPVFSRKSPNCIKSDFRKFKQTQSGEGVVLMLALGGGHGIGCFKRISKSFFKFALYF